MRTYLVVTLTCPDRPGIVERVTEVLARHSANWEESRMAHLGGDFAGIVKVSVAEEKTEALTAALRALADQEMTVSVKVTQSPTAASREPSSLYELRLVGADHEGIVHRVSSYLASQGVNVEAMETEVIPAPVSATPLFHMTAQIKTPASLSLNDLNANLRDIGEQLGVDIEVLPSRE